MNKGVKCSECDWNKADTYSLGQKESPYIFCVIGKYSSDEALHDCKHFTCDVKIRNLIKEM